MTKRVDVSPWNLSVSLLALAACGPLIPGLDSGNDDDSVSDTDPTDPTDPTDETPIECVDDDDCQGYGYACIAGSCEYECLGCCGAGLEDDDEFRCSPPPYYDCYSDDDCGPGYTCSFGYCDPEPMPGCDAVPSFNGELSLSFADGGLVSKLMYAALDGSSAQQLLAVRDDLVMIASETESLVVIDAEGPIQDAIAVDMDADGQIDVVTATGGAAPAVTLWRGLGGGFDPAPIATVPVLAWQLAIGDWQGDGIVDLVVRTDSGVELIAGGPGGTLALPTVLLGGAVTELAVFDADLDGRHDVAAQTAFGHELVLAVDGFSRGLAPPSGPAVAFGLHASDFDTDGWPDLVTVLPDYSVVAWDGPVFEPTEPSSRIYAGVAIGATTGDVDLDGRMDLLVSRDDAMVSILYGGASVSDELIPAQPFSCESLVGLSLLATSVAVGDHDGDGDRDLAVSDGTSVRVLVQ